MLMEEQIDFAAIGPEDDLSLFETIVVPSRAGVLDGYETKVADYLKTGGKLLVLGEGALDSERGRLALDLGAEYLGPARYDMDYTLVNPELAAEGLVTSPFLNYSAALRLAPTTAQVLARLREPYFSRTFRTYCGHQNTPYRLEDAEHPAVIRQGNTVCLAHAVDRMYYQHGAKAHRQLFINTLRLLHKKPMAEAELPSSGRISLLHQPEHQRYVLHLLYASPLQRGRCLVIEDLPELRDVNVLLRLPETIQSLRLVPAGGSLAMMESGDAIATTIPAFSCHCAIVAEY
jgi:hypothetical protein